MAMKLMLDGKPIGEIGEDGQIKDASGAVVQAEPTGDDDKNKMKVPLITPFDQQAMQPVVQVPLEPEGGAKSKDEPKGEFDADTQVALENKLLQRQVAALQQQLQQQGSKATVTRDGDGNVALDLAKTIPDDLNDENDPIGVARALKGMAKVVEDMGTKVSRMDQHTGFTEYNRVLENEKEEYPEIFKDKKIGKIADKLLTAELSMNPTAPISGVVADVVKEVMSLGVTPSEKDKTKAKIKEKEKVPRTLRTTEGAPPTISITPPKNVKESAEAYREWRAARDKRLRGM